MKKNKKVNLQLKQNPSTTIATRSHRLLRSQIYLLQSYHHHHTNATHFIPLPKCFLHNFVIQLAEKSRNLERVMVAYAAVVCLKKTIECILESSRISLVLPSPQVIQLAYKELKRLQEIRERLGSTSRSKSRKKINALDWKIMDAVWKFDDLLESHLSDHILSLFDRKLQILKVVEVKEMHCYSP